MLIKYPLRVSLIPFVAEHMNLDFKISQDAEVISSIGVALAMVRREVAPGTTLHARWEGGDCTMQIAGQEKGATG